MTGKVLVLGAKGRLGRAAVRAFAQDEWTVRALARSWDEGKSGTHIEYVAGDALADGVAASAAAGCDVIVNGLNPPYTKWHRLLPQITQTVIAAAYSNGATIVVPGNVYGYGETMPTVLTADTPYAPSTPLGQLRAAMEQSYQGAACAHGVQTLIVQAGDFIEREKTGNWFDSHICAQLAKGRIMYPGPRDRVHAWAYLPDLARVMSELSQQRRELPPFTRVGFAGYGLSGDALIRAVQQSMGRQLTVKEFPWRTIKLLGLAAPQLRALAQLSYLWRVPHRFDDAALKILLPQFKPTSLDAALADVLEPVRLRLVVQD